jgi:hypothetical protein
MLIVFGTKVRYRRMGYRADFCQICREARPFKIQQIESIGHLYYIPLGAGTVHAHLKTCQGCGMLYEATPDDAMTCSKTRGDPDELIARGRPQIEHDWSDRLDLESRVKSGKLTASERESLILEPFLLLNPTVQHHTAQISFDWASGLGLLAAIAVPLAMLWVGPGLLHRSQDTSNQVAAILAGILVLFTIGAFATYRRRYIRRAILPKLASALAPLDPTAGEIDQTLARLKEMKWAIGRRIKADDVMSAVHRQRVLG